MKGRFYIDGIDVFNTYSILIAYGGCKGLLTYPAGKEPDANDWAEENGLEVDLSEGVKLKAKEFDIDFITANKNADIDGFLQLIADGIDHDFMFVDFAEHRILRLISGRRYEGITLNTRGFTLRFSEDNPFANYSYIEPTHGSYPNQKFMIDNINIANYGMAVTVGTEGELLKMTEKKQNFAIDIKNRSGVIYDQHPSMDKHRDARINLLLTANSAVEFTRNHNALLHNLIKPGERSLYFSDLNASFPFYYKDCGVNQFYLDDRYWLDFYIIICLYQYSYSGNVYLGTTQDSLVSSDNSNIPNSGLIVIANEDDLVDVEGTFEEGTGSIEIDLESDRMEFDLGYEEGALTVE